MKTLCVITGLLVVVQLPVDDATPTSAFDSRGLYGDPHRPDDPDADLLLEEGHDNSTQIVNTDHVYYVSKTVSPGEAGGADVWVDVERADRSRWKTWAFLSGTNGRAERVHLSFDFPFYGHTLTEVTVTSGGFIYTGDLINHMLTATQYIAPLMANFDPAFSGNSSVFYFDNGSVLVVQWSRLRLRDSVHSGAFTFQAALHDDGRIVFSYKEIPVEIADISGEDHPVKVGLSDAFVVLHKIQQIPNVRRRTIYEYHKVDIVKSKISNATTIEILPLPTCLRFSSCAACVTSQIGFNCSWCSRLQRCSSGFDRHRQDWVDHGCHEERRDHRCLRALDVTDPWFGHRTAAPASTSGGRKSSTAAWLGEKEPTRSEVTATSTPRPSVGRPAENGDDDVGRPGQAGLLVGVVMLTVVVVTGILLSVYVYHHPTSGASLFFMERRRARWPAMKFRRGSGRPSYAEVEPDGGVVVIDPKRSFVMAVRRESEQREGFVVPDPRERFLCSESS